MKRITWFLLGVLIVVSFSALSAIKYGNIIATSLSTATLKMTTSPATDYSIKGNSTGQMSWYAGAKGIQISNNSGNFATNSTTWADVTNLTVSLTTTGRPVFLMLTDYSTYNSYVGVSRTESTAATGYIEFVRDSTEISHQQFKTQGASGDQILSMPPSSVSCIDNPSAGTYVYKIMAKTSSSSDYLNCYYCRLIAFEL